MEEPIIVTDHVSDLRDINKKKRRRLDFIIGLVIIVFAMIGLVNAIILLFQTSQSVLNNSKQKEEWEAFTLPVVMADPVPFSDPSSLEQVTLQEIAIYSSLVNNSVDSFQRDPDTDYLIIPQSEVDKQIEKLFGTSVKIQHTTSGMGFSDMIVNDVYTPSAPTTFVYVPAEGDGSSADQTGGYYSINLQELNTGDMFIPQVISIKKEGNEIKIEVGYVTQPQLWDEEKSIQDRKPDKKYEYTIVTDEKGNPSIKQIEALTDGVQGTTDQTLSSQYNANSNLPGEDETSSVLSSQETSGAA